MLCVLKWLGSLLCFATATAWLISAGHALTWQSSRYELSLIEASIAVGWRPEGYEPAKDKYRGPGGFLGVADYADSRMHFNWLPTKSRLKAWEGVSIPLWIVFVLIAIPTGWLWWKGREATCQFIASILRSLAPNQRVGLRIGLVWLFVFVHFITLFLVRVPVERSLGFLFPNSNADFWGGMILAFLLITSPMFGILWAWLWVRLRNELFSRFNEGRGCTKCGYDLRGNVSGTCPECGTPVQNELQLL